MEHPLSGFIWRVEQALLPVADGGLAKNLLREMLAFGVKEACCCLFPVFIFGVLLLSSLYPSPFLPRYDLLLLLCVFFQGAMLYFGFEDRRELLVISLFHLIGLCLEIFKVNHGAWSYPEFAFSKVAGVPLYSGFMYAAVGSYVCQAWQLLEIRLAHWPRLRHTTGACCLIYANFFTNHYLPDLRFFLFVILLVLFFRTSIVFRTNGQERTMPMITGLALVGFFVWIAENIATFFKAWQYPNQAQGWDMVDFRIVTSWFLMVTMSAVLVFTLRSFEAGLWEAEDHR